MAWFGKDRGAPAPAAEEQEDKLRRYLALLLEGIRLHTCNEDEAFAPHFNRLIRQLGTQLDVATNESEMLGVITAAIDGMKNAKREGTAVINQCREESKLLSRFLMTTLIGTLAPTKPETAGLIEDLGPEFERAKLPEELKAVREKLEYIFAPEETKVVKAEEAPAEKPWSEEEVEAETADSPTGLRGRAKAKELLTKVHSGGQPCFAAVLFLEGYMAIEERFGADAAQDCQIAASNYLLQSLGGSDQLFHWDRHALLAIVSRECKQSDVALEMLRICSARSQQSIRVGQRTVMAAMPIKPQVIAINEVEEYDDLLQQIDQFARQ